MKGTGSEGQHEIQEVEIDLKGKRYTGEGASSSSLHKAIVHMVLKPERMHPCTL